MMTVLHANKTFLPDYIPKFFVGRRDSVIGNQSVVSRFEMKQVASFTDHESPVSSTMIILTPDKRIIGTLMFHFS